MKKILFITGNKRKVWQAQDRLKQFGVEVEQGDLDLDEIQNHDPLKIAIAKAEAAYDQYKRPLVVCDHSWNFHALKGFPGGYMKDMNGWFEPEDWLALMKNKEDRSVTLTETIIYIDGSTRKQFSVDFQAKVIDEPRGKSHVSMEQVVSYLDSDKTIAEHIEAGEHARDMSNSAWQHFGEWYSKQQ